MEHVNVLIVGAGISGIGMGCHLRKRCPDKSFTILEGRASLGGTWDLFRYPGIRSDSDMFTFGYSFKPWVQDQDIASGEAILRYLEETVDEHGLRDEIRFDSRVETLSWSSEHKRWVARVSCADGASYEISCDFVVAGTGYYDYERGYLPEWEGFDRYRGVVARPQHWPEDLDYAGKRVLVIGSGATAVTLVPSMAKSAAHVTMLQRSPTYIFSRPAEDPIAKTLRAHLPTTLAYKLSRAKNITLQRAAYAWARVAPQRARAMMRQQALDGVGPDVDVDVHFNPRYQPWDQRVCLIPDDDLYRALREERASIVTDTIDHFTETGVVLTSGQVIEADIVVPATGLSLKFLSNIRMDIDGEPVSSGELVTYKGMMFAGIPNFAAVFGYTSASWTLKADLACEYVCRLLQHMKRQRYDVVVPELEDRSEATRPLMGALDSGYVKRAADRMPKQSSRKPWANLDDYFGDVVAIRLGRIEDGALRFGRSVPAPGSRFRFGDKTAVVTGAASGIGEALAKDLAGRGCHLVLVDRDAAGLERVAKLARSRRVNVSTHVVDLGDREAIKRFAAQLDAGDVEVDLLINNAGVALGGEFGDVTEHDFDWLMNINLGGVVSLTRALLPRMRRRPDAHIANVSSVFGMIAPPGQTAYCASKFAVRGFSESLRHELEGTSVGVSVIHPGGIKTSIAKNARLPEGVDRADMTKELAEMEKKFITAPEKAAQIILAGIERRRARIMVGPDARLIEVIERLFPTTNMQVLAKLFGLQRPQPPSRVRRKVEEVRAQRAAAAAHGINGDARQFS